MICEICKKNPATIHIQEIINKQKKSINICQECAAKKSNADGALDGMNLAKFIYNIASQAVEGNQDNSETQEIPDAPSLDLKMKCPHCGWTSDNFAKNGRLGCEDCYHTYGELLSPALKNMHKGIIHVGKKPGGSENAERDGFSAISRIAELQKDLEDCVRKEEFEKAAFLRDEIINLKKSIEKESQP